jgi:hypothetical protein
MSKFNKPSARPNVTSVVTSEDVPSGRTHEGAPGFARDAKSELFLLAVSNMVGENTFYEQAQQRDDRFVKLVHKVTALDPEWMVSFIGWLRGEGNMRSASAVAAAEMACYFQKNPRVDAPKGQEAGPVRLAIAAACQRADEPGELLAYWTSKYGRKIPKAVKRGLGDAVGRLYNEYAFLKYDTGAFRFGDVLELTHPSPDPGKPYQGALFAHALDVRHGREIETESLNGVLPMLHANHVLRWMVAQGDVPNLYDPQGLKDAGMTWEDVLSLGGQHKLNKRKLWEAVIPSMGIMALVRNLRNFDEAMVSDQVAQLVIDKLTNPEVIARSRMFPFRFLSAYKAAPSLRWGYPLQKAVDLSLSNVPSLPGKTLILVDQSGSMFSYVSEKSKVLQAEQAAIFGSALAMRAREATLVSYGSTSRVIPHSPAEGLLKVVGRFESMGGTETARTLAQHYKGHDRVIIITDEQAHSYYGGGTPGDQISNRVPLYTWNLAGYQRGHEKSGGVNRHTFGGLTDASFRMIPLIEAGRNGTWPWES